MSSWTTTVSNSVRNSAPVGQTSRHPASVQCLQTSDDISQRSPSASGSASTPLLDTTLSSAACCASDLGIPCCTPSAGRGAPPAPAPPPPGPRLRPRRLGAPVLPPGRQFLPHDPPGPQGARAEPAGVVVGVAEPVEPVLGHVVPLLAGDLARLAA